jgi:type VI secretion system Hcp family effector
MKRAIAALTIAAIATAALATNYGAYMTVTGDSQGQFHGAGRSKSHRIPIITFNQKMTAKKADKSIGTITLTLDPVDINEFRKALQNHENLSDVSLDIMKTSRDGTLMVAQKMKLTNAKVTSVNVSMQSGKGGSHEVEKVAMTFQRVAYTKPIAKTFGIDDWKN